MGSILAQEFDQLEVILVDDGSTDDTPAEAARLAASDSRIRIFQQPNQGQSAAFNRGLAEARGEFAIMLSDDDVLYPRCLATVVPVFEENPSVAVVTGEFDLIDWDNRVLGSHCSPLIELKTFLADHLCNIGVGAAFRVEAARLAGGWNPQYRHVPDMDFWMRMALQGDFRHVPVKLGGWRTHTGQVSANAREGSVECAREHLRCIDEYLERSDLPDELRALAGRARASAFIVAAIVTDPGLFEPDRRFLVLDRISMALDSEGRAGQPEDALRYLYETAEERLQLINTLDADLRMSLSRIETLS
ncbi:MAG: glycosyltransferase, partial [Verrucomicrobiales bacterium]